jgi:hypothetical protein
MSEETSREPDIADAEIARRDILGVRQKIALGAAIDRFMQSDEGRALQQLANFDMDRATEKLALHDASDVAGIRQLQLDYRVAASLLSYLGQMVQEGINAENTFREADAAG